MSDEAKLAHIRQLAAARAKRYYEANKAKIAERRKAQRQACREAMSKEPAPPAPAKPEPQPEPAPAKRLRMKRPKMAPAKPEPEPQPEPALASAPAPVKRLRRRPKMAPAPVRTLSVSQAEKVIAESASIQADESRKTYLSHLTAVARILSCDDLITCFQDAPKVIQTLTDAKQKKDPTKGYSIASKKAYTQAILKLSDVLEIPLSKETKQAYVDAFDAMKLDVKNEAKERQDAAKESKEEPLTFQTYLPKVKEHYGEDSKEYLIASLYSLHGFRDDLQLEITDKPDNTKNHLIVPKRGQQWRIHLNQYKTAGKYGEKTIALPRPIGNLVQSYIKRNKLKKGDYLFGDKLLSGFVSKMNKTIGLPLTINNLRELHVAPVIDDMSSKERVELAKKMNHSASTSEHYRRKKKA